MGDEDIVDNVMTLLRAVYDKPANGVVDAPPSLLSPSTVDGLSDEALLSELLRMKRIPPQVEGVSLSDVMQEYGRSRPYLVDSLKAPAVVTSEVKEGSDGVSGSPPPPPPVLDQYPPPC